jgi:hypothetical protein
MRFRYATVLLVLLVVPGFAQTVTTLNLSTQGHNPDFSNFPFTRPISVGSAIPPTCQMGQLFFNTTAAAGQNMYACTQTNTWAVMGSYTLLPAGSSALGGVVIPSNSALSVDGNGVLSANVGTGAGTLAAGNDARIVNALQPTSQISAANVVGLARSATTDTTNASNILTGTLSVSLLPSTINSNTNGNAATASSLSAIPSACVTNQYALGILANGTARCAQVAYGQVSGAPTLYNQHLQVGGSTQTQRVNVNFAAGSNVTITPTDNGSSTTTLTISDTGLQAPSTVNSLVKYSTGTSTTAAQSSDITSTLGFTPQNVTGLNAPNGYAGLDLNGLLLVSEMPPTINSNTSGKAATATALAATPGVCAEGQFATGIGPNGNAICGTPTGTGGLPDPGSNGLVKRTAANADAAAIAGTDYYAPGTQISDADLPNTITSSITGNAASATQLAATPALCPGGQFATGIGANGNATCGVPSSGGSGVATGTSLPAASTCTATTLGNLYAQTRPSSASGGQNERFFACQQSNTSYAWWPVTDGRVNVMGFGCKADGTTNDQPCFQAAINFASTMNQYANWDGGASYLGADIYVPCGNYAIASPIVLPRSGSTSSHSYSANNGTVGMVGENHNCAAITGISGNGFNGVGGVYVTSVGSGYSSTPTVSFSGGCSTEPVGAATLQTHSSISFIDTVYLTSYGSGCTSMPTCTITGGGGSGASCEALGLAMIQWAPLAVGTFQRTFGEKITQIRFREPNQAGVMAIHFQSSNYPIPGSCSLGWNDVCERMENAEFSWLDFLGSNTYQPASIMISGDCNTCAFSHLTSNPSGGSTQNYQTPLIATTFANGSIQDEADGLQYGNIDTLSCGGDKNGSAPCFQGRLQRATMKDTFCDGIRNGVPNTTCYAFYNSSITELTNIGNEGNGGIQMLLENSRHFIVTNLGIGSPVASSTDPPLGGVYLLGSSQNKFVNLFSGTTSFQPFGVYRVFTDSTSYQNEFLNYEIDSTNEVSISNTASNFFQYCIVNSTCNTNTPFSTIGTPPF